MEYYSVSPVNEHVYRLTGLGHEMCYLVVGSKKAALIDTGVGCGNLMEVIRSITDLPIIVLLTHGHADHVGGIGAFEEVYIHQKDTHLLKEETSLEVRRKYLKMENREAEKNICEDDYIPVVSLKTYPIKDRQKFDLGKAVLEVVEAPAHTKGSVCFIERKQKLLFTGDLCTPLTLMILPDSTGMFTLQKTMDKLEHMKSSYDRILPAHGPEEAPMEVFENVQECIADILAESDDMEPYRVFGHRGYLARKTSGKSQAHREDGKYGNVCYPEA